MLARNLGFAHRARAASALALRHRSASSSAGRTFRVLGLQQVAIGGLDKHKLSVLWEGVLGIERVGEYGEQIPRLLIE